MKRSEFWLVVAAALAVFATGASLPVYAAHAIAARQQRDALASPAPGTQQPASKAVDETDTAAATEAAAKADKAARFHNGIVAIVNDHPISEYDLRQRVALVMTTSNVPKTPEMVKKIREQTLEQLETEQIQRQEALKNDITVSSVEVDKEIERILTDYHMTMDQLKELLASGHVAMATLRAQIASSILWQRTVSEEYAGRIKISPEAVDAQLARMMEGANKAHFAVSEIFLAVDSPEQDDKVRKDAQNLETQIQAGAPFVAIARQFSQSPSSAQGGDIGVVFDGQLAPELNEALEKMKTGEISAPIRSTGGYYILALRQRYEPADAEIVEAAPAEVTATDTLPLARVLLPLPPNRPKQLLENALKVADTIRSHASDCDVLGKIAQKVQGAAFFNLGMTKLADLSQQIRDALAKTEPGTAAAAFISAAGAEVIMRCDKPIVKKQRFVLPTREQVEEQLFSEQISAMARRFTRDLKRNADIEVR